MHLLHSFYSFEYVLKLSIKNTTKLIKKAREKREENMAREVYLTIYPYMTKETYISFEDFYNLKNNEQKQIKEKSEEEILLEVKGIIDTYNGGDENRNI